MISAGCSGDDHTMKTSGDMGDTLFIIELSQVKMFFS
jgi:hypothetical protein